MRYLVILIFAVAVVALAFRQAPDLPGTNFDESFLPKASSVKYIAAGNDASVAGLFWIKGLTELGESYLSGKEYAYLSHVANLCTELDALLLCQWCHLYGFQGHHGLYRFEARFATLPGTVEDCCSLCPALV